MTKKVSQLEKRAAQLAAQLQAAEAIDVIIIDEIDGWEKFSLQEALPKLLAQAKVRQKGIVLIGQSIPTSAIADILPANSRWISIDVRWAPGQFEEN